MADSDVSSHRPVQAVGLPSAKKVGEHEEALDSHRRCTAVRGGGDGWHRRGSRQGRNDGHDQVQRYGFQGKVKSSKSKCVKNRTVKVYKQKGSSQDPSTDKKMFKDTSGSDGSWDTGNSGQAKGRFYALATGTDSCKKGFSKTIKV